tara:strand:- start:1232 stop:1822 length:591 start_codon:yes stop_codon:yes gene_type:complete
MKDNFKKLYDSFDKSIYIICSDLIKNICNDLNNSDKIDVLIEKYLLKPNTKITKKIKDTNAPKRNKSAYMFFQEEVRPKLKAKFPQDTLGQLSKRLGKLWGDLKDKDKRKYDKLAEKDKQRYEKDLETYNTDFKKKETNKYSSEEDIHQEKMDSSISEDDSYIIHGNSSSSNSNSNSESDSYSDCDSDNKSDGSSL